MKAPENKTPWRVATLVTLAISAAGCEYFMFHVGRRNPSALLMAMFAVWVLAPFAALFWCHARATRWPRARQAVLIALSLLVAGASPLVYGYVALGPPRPQPAFFFLVLPLSSLVLIAAVVWLSRNSEAG